MSSHLYQLKGVTKRYNGRVVLDLKDLFFPRGKVIGLQGPNGAGKTTLLEILAFLMPPTEGTLLYEGTEVHFSGPRVRAVRRKVVLVQQHPIMFTTTAFKNVEFPLKIRGIPKVKRFRIVSELLDLVGMSGFGNVMANTLSGGESQRVAIARALACEPMVILLDEPTTAVDLENQVTVERIIKEINRERGISVIFTSHDLLQAARLADEAVFLFEGQVADPIYENIFRGNIVEGRGGPRRCVLPGGVAPVVVSKRLGPTRVRIDPKALRLLGGRADERSDENTFSGKLVYVTSGPAGLRALVDIGIPLSVFLEGASFKGLGVLPGDGIRIHIPRESIRVF